MATTTARPGEPPPASDSDVRPTSRDPEPVRRARFQNLLWREQHIRETHVVVGPSAGPKAPQADVPTEWLREYDRHQPG